MHNIDTTALCSEGAPGELLAPNEKDSIQALLLCNVLSGCGYASIENEKESDIALKAVQGTLETLYPKDAMEERLVAQLVSLQERGMQFLKQSHSAISVEQQNLYVNMYTKTFRIANETVDMLQKWRRKGAQTVVVQHVSVGDGGKAIVGGNMIAGGGQV